MSQLITCTIKIISSAVLCGLIGMERGVRHKGAGMRTHILVGVGSTLIVLTSLHLFDIYKDITVVDPTRMITGIVTGVGFLCAGTIIRAGSQVSGLTTAATLWIVSGIGISVGSGAYIPAILVSIIVFLVLITLRPIERRVNKLYRKKSLLKGRKP